MTTASKSSYVGYLLKAIALVFALACAYSILAGDGDNDVKAADSMRDIELVEHGKYKDDCGGCHLAYLPGLLPERSWRKMMGDLKNHFGESAEMDQPTSDEILRWLVHHSAERGTRRSKMIAKSIPPDQSPLRISETPYFKIKHHEIDTDVWKRKSIISAANCAACHPKAEKGRFNAHEVQIPR